MVQPVGMATVLLMMWMVSSNCRALSTSIAHCVLSTYFCVLLRTPQGASPQRSLVQTVGGQPMHTSASAHELSAPFWSDVFACAVDVPSYVPTVAYGFWLLVVDISCLLLLQAARPSSV